MVLCTILACTTKQLDMSRIVFEDMHYDALFKGNMYITDAVMLLTRIGISDASSFVGHIEYVEEFLSKHYDSRLMNYISVAYDSGYFINLHLKVLK